VAGRSNDVIIAVISDGAGSAKFAKQGSTITCRTISEAARNHFKSTSSPPTDEDIWGWVDQAREIISLSAERMVASRRDFSATLVAVIASDTETITLHIGDGAAVCNFDGQWTVPSWPAQGEYASTTFFVTDDPAPELRITRLPIRANALALFSDGIERLVLRFADETVSASFFDKLCTTVRSRGRAGASDNLNAALRRYLDGPAINERTDDDKSLIVAVRL